MSPALAVGPCRLLGAEVPHAALLVGRRVVSCFGKVLSCGELRPLLGDDVSGVMSLFGLLFITLGSFHYLRFYWYR